MRPILSDVAAALLVAAFVAGCAAVYVSAPERTARAAQASCQVTPGCFQAIPCETSVCYCPAVCRAQVYADVEAMLARGGRLWQRLPEWCRC
jgi:hypothetical protein